MRTGMLGHMTVDMTDANHHRLGSEHKLMHQIAHGACAMQINGRIILDMMIRWIADGKTGATETWEIF